MDLPRLSIPPLPFKVPTSLIFNTPILVIVLVVFFTIYIIVSGVLWFHWSKYGMNNNGIQVGRSLFVFVSAILFGFAIAGLYYF